MCLTLRPFAVGGSHLHAAPNVHRAVSSRSCQQLLPPRRLVVAAPLLTTRCRTSGDDDLIQILQGIQQLQQQAGTLQHGIKQLQQQMGTLQQQMGTLQQQMGTMQQQMGTMQQQAGTLQQQAGTLQHDIKQLQQQMQWIRSDQCHMLEAQAKAAVGQMFGAEYARQLLAQSLQDLALLLPLTKPHDILLQRLELAERASKQLVDDSVPDRLLHAIYTRLAADDPALPPWFDQDGKLLRSNLGTFIDSCQDEPLKEGLQRLRNAAAMSQPDPYTELLKCNSASIMCMIASALPALYLNQSSSRNGAHVGSNTADRSIPTPINSSDKDSIDLARQAASTEASSQGWDPTGGSRHACSRSSTLATQLLPPRVLDFDFCGRMYVGADHAFIDVGEYASTVPQLGVKLSVLRWLVHVSCDVPYDGIRCVGRMFVPTRTISAGLEKQQRTLAKDTWQYDLHLHEV